MNFKNWLLLTESKEEKALALELAGDQNILNELQKVIKPKDKNTIDKLLVLASYYYNKEKDLERIKKDIQDYIQLLNNNTMKLMTVDPATKQPSMEYGNWINIIHGHQGEAAAKDRKNFQVTDQDFQGEEPIDTSPDGTIKVYKANSPQQCIILGKGHSFCVSKPGNTMWQSYRDSKISTFYFVKDNSRNDRLSTVVVDMTRNGPELTDVVNTTGKTLDPYTGEVTNKTDPYFKYLKEKGINISKIEHIKQTPEEQKENQKLGRQNQYLNWFVNLSHTDKSKYIGRGHLLTDEQFDHLWENGFESLLEQYAKTGLQLPDYQIDKIATNSDLRSNYVHNRLLANDHTQKINGKEFELLNQKQKENVLNKTKNIESIISTSKNPDETAEFIIQNKKDLTEENFYYLFTYAINKNKIAKLLGSENINKLYGQHVYYLLLHATNKDEMAKILGSENINKLTDKNVDGLLNDTKNPYEMAKLIIQYKDLTDQNVRDLPQHEIDRDKIAELIIQKKKDLTDNNIQKLLAYARSIDKIAELIIQKKKDLTDYDVYNLLHYAENKYEIAKLLGQENINKLGDDYVDGLLSVPIDRDKIEELIIQYKKDLTDNNITALLSDAKNRDRIAQLLGSENINKLSDDHVKYLLDFTRNPDEMRRILQKYGRIQ